LEIEMASIQETVTVKVPVSTAYNQWTQFEEFPRFMEGVKEVQQLDDNQLHWCAQIAGKDVEWDAEITEQTPDKRIEWTSTSGPLHGGVVTFAPADSNSARITLAMSYDPEGFAENIASATGLVTARVKGDLNRFKEYVESRGKESGAWRGEIHGREMKS
jgi:uncharacterized membrane protein